MIGTKNGRDWLQCLVLRNFQNDVQKLVTRFELHASLSSKIREIVTALFLSIIETDFGHLFCQITNYSDVIKVIIFFMLGRRFCFHSFFVFLSLFNAFLENASRVKDEKAITNLKRFMYIPPKMQFFIIRVIVQQVPV